MKDLLVCGIDDGYFPLSFKGRRGYTVLLAACFKNSKLVSVNFDTILVDGNDATQKLFKITEKSEVLLLDGITFGGFNYVNPETVGNNGFSYIVFYSQMPNVNEVEKALRKHFNDERICIILNTITSLTKLPTRKGEVFVMSNLPLNEVSEIINFYQFFVKEPEPLRTAHIIASSLSKFLLRKKLT